MPLLQLRFDLEVLTPIRLPIFSGSTFRGTLGWALKESGCARGGICEECQMPNQCSYSYLFETREGGDDSPRPFVVDPPDEAGDLQPGQIFRIGVTLIGSGVEHRGAVEQGFAAMGGYGLGAWRGTFRVRECFYSRAQTLGERIAPDLGECGHARVVFTSPTRLVFRGQLNDRPECHVLVRNALRRIDKLMQLHGSGPLEVDYPRLIQQAQEVRLGRHRLDWFDFKRHSNRQERPVVSGGVIGYAHYEGPLTELLPFLLAAQYLHLGKGTTYGLGRIRVFPGLGEAL